MSLRPLSLVAMGEESDPKGTGNRLARAVIIVAGVAALASILISFLSIWLQLKSTCLISSFTASSRDIFRSGHMCMANQCTDYRKPLLQRYVVRILIMVPIYAASSWASVVSLQAAFYLDPLRDIYEAFTIYTFLQLLVNFMGGERQLIIMMHGRAPVSHPWPLSLYFTGRHLGSTYLPGCQKRHPAVCLPQTYTCCVHHCHEVDRHIPRGIHRPELGLSLVWYRLQHQYHAVPLRLSHVLGVHAR